MSKKGFVCGVFDLFHAGHVMMLQDCKKECDHLTVALNRANQIDVKINPNKQAPIYSIEERQLIMASCRYVDEVLVYNNEEELYELLIKGEYDVRFLGEDYRGKLITGEHLIQGIKYLDRSHGLSTSNYKKMIVESDKKSNIEKA